MSEFDFSDSIARISSAMTTGCDEVPFIAQMHEFAMCESGIPGDEFYTDAKKFVRGICETAERFGFDTPSFIWDVYNVEAQALGCRFVTFKDMAPAIENSDPLVKTEKDISRFKAPDPYSSGRMPMVFEIMQEIKDLAGMTPFPCYCAPFTLASHVIVSAAGNAAGTGARVALLNKSARMEIEDLVRRVEKIETAVEPMFQQHFIDAIAIPHGSESFPNLSRSVNLPIKKTATGEKENAKVSRRQQRKLKLAR